MLEVQLFPRLDIHSNSYFAVIQKQINVDTLNLYHMFILSISIIYRNFKKF